MRLIKLLVYSLVFFFVLIFLFSLMFPSDVRISKTINMKVDQQVLLHHIKDLKQWKTWNPAWQQMDEKDISILDSANGIVSAMRVNNTSIKITGITKDEILMQYSGGKKNNVYSGIHTIQYPQSDSLIVQWYMDFKLKWYPWEKFSSLLYEKMYGEQMKMGLENLKQLYENKTP